MPFKDPIKRAEYSRRKNRELYHTRRDAWFKKNNRCVDCGSKENLQLSFKDPSKRVTHRVFLLTKVKREAELKKLQARCKTCWTKHVITKFRKTEPLPSEDGHGYQRYKKGCRCEVCTRANTENGRRHKIHAKLVKLQKDSE